jgi:hypothetical protein
MMTTPSRFKFIPISILFLMSVITSFSQENIKFGKIDIADLQMKRCPFDSAADAMILGDIGSSHYEYNDAVGFELVFDRLLRIKIFNKDGFSQGNIEFELNYDGSETEKVTSIKGRTYNLESGKIVETKLDDGSIFEEIQDSRIKIKKVSFPAIREGSVIELKYSIQSPFLGYINEWHFQGAIPVRWSEYEVSIPEFFTFGRQASGFAPFAISERSSHNDAVTLQATTHVKDGWATTSGGTERNSIKYMVNVEKLATRNIPALRSEPFSRPTEYYSTKVRYELRSYKFPGDDPHMVTSSWQDVIDRLLKDENFGQQITKSGLVKDIKREIEMKSKTAAEKMSLAQEYIRQHFRSNGKTSKFPTSNLKRAFELHSGNCADINLSLVLLLKELDLDAYPLVTCTRDHGMILESNPTLAGFNYVMACVKIDTTMYLLDATDPYLPPAFIPRDCINGNGLVIANNRVQWVPLSNTAKDGQLLYTDLVIDTLGTLKGRFESSLSGYLAAEERSDYHAKGENSYKSNLKNQLKSWEIDELTMENIDKPDQGFTVKYSLKSSDICEKVPGLIYLNVLSGQGQKTNPFTSEKRNFPVDFIVPFKDTYVFNYQVPEGYTIESIPEAIKLSLPDQAGMFKFLAVAKENKIMISSNLVLTKTFFQQNEYENLKEFLKKIIEKHSQQIVLKRK